MESDPPKIHVSLSMKVNIGNYENQDLSFGVSGVPVNCGPEYLEAVILGAKERTAIIFESLADEMTRILRENYGR